jgi:hypothetical protein
MLDYLCWWWDDHHWLVVGHELRLVLSSGGVGHEMLLGFSVLLLVFVVEDGLEFIGDYGLVASEYSIDGYLA